MPSLPAVIPSTAWADGDLITAANLWTRLISLAAAVRTRVNPKTSIWHAVATAVPPDPTTTVVDAAWSYAFVDTTLVDTDNLGIMNGTFYGYRAPIAGYYLVSGKYVITDSNSIGRVAAAVAVNGQRLLDGTRSAADTSGSGFTSVATGTTLLKLAEGDIVSLMGWQDTAGDRTAGRSTLTVRRWSA